MAIQIGAKPDSGFDDPIGMLTDCHRRIERFLHILCVVSNRAMGRNLTDEEKLAVESALKYFRVGGLRHTADEEESLFPRLRMELVARNVEDLGRLVNDHRCANDLHAAVDALYTSWIVAGHLTSEGEQRLHACALQLKSLYEEHIQIEEKIVFPLAAEMLDSQTIAAIGQEFVARRK